MKQSENGIPQHQDILELPDEELAMVTGRGGGSRNQGTIKTKDLAKDLKDAGFTARPAKSGSHVIWTHDALPGHNVTLQSQDRAAFGAVIAVRDAIKQVKAKSPGQSSGQSSAQDIDIDQI